MSNGTVECNMFVFNEKEPLPRGIVFERVDEANGRGCGGEWSGRVGHESRSCRIGAQEKRLGGWRAGEAKAFSVLYDVGRGLLSGFVRVSGVCSPPPEVFPVPGGGAG